MITIIYAGGTFGCFGRPLAPLPLPQLQPFIALTLGQSVHANIVAMPNIKDSSQIELQDWLDLLSLINLYLKQGCTQFIIIYGTDTLAYTSAFLSEVFAEYAISIVITGSQYPLLKSTVPLQIDQHSDAVSNLAQAYQFVEKNVTGVFTCFNQQILIGDTVQKVHTTARDAFAGQVYTMSTYTSSSIKSAVPIDILRLKEPLNKLKIHVYYVLPLSVEQHCLQLRHILALQPDAIVIMAFGAGNFTQHPSIEQILADAFEQEVLVLLSSQVPFGGVTAKYAAGSWLEDFNVITTGAYTLSAVYAKTMWVCAIESNFKARRILLQSRFKKEESLLP